MKFNNNKYQIKIYKENINNSFHLALKRIIKKEEILFLPFTHNNEISSDTDILCVQDMKHKYSGKTYITYGYKLIDNHIHIVNSDECDGYLLISKRDIRSVPELQRIKTEEICKIAKERIDKVIPQINAYMKHSIYNVIVEYKENNKTWDCWVFTETIKGVKQYLYENTPMVDSELDKLIEQIN